MGFDLACPGMTWMMAVWFGLALLAGVYSGGKGVNKQTKRVCGRCGFVQKRWGSVSQCTRADGILNT